MTKRKAGEGGLTANGYMKFGRGSQGYYKGKKYTGAVVKLGHRIVVEKVLGRPLKADEEVHHWNEVKTDNRNENLVICPNRAYHMLLHQRARAYHACGHADWLRCSYCKIYDDPKNMSFRSRGKNRPGKLQWAHARCAADYVKARYVPRVAA